MSIKEKLKERLPEITFLGAISDFATFFATIIFCGVFVFFGITHKEFRKKQAEQEAKQAEIIERKCEVDNKAKQIAIKSEKEFGLWNKKYNTDFIFPMEFDIKNDTDFEIRYNSEYNENSTHINQQILYSGMPVGVYNFPKLPVGEIIIKNVQNRINEFLEENENGIIKIKVRGTSDNTPVNEKAKYIGDLGYGTIRYYEIKEDNTIEEKTRTLIEDTELSNEDFALLRAYSVVAYFKKEFELKDENIQIFVQIYNKKGPKYRRCDFSVTLENYFIKFSELDR